MALAGETPVIVGTPVGAEAAPQPIIIAAVKSVEKARQIRYMSFPTLLLTEPRQL